MNAKNYLNEKNPKVLMTLEKFGEVEIELFLDVAPITAENFLDLVSEKFYNGLTFHRIIKGFMIQGGDPLGNGMGGSKKYINGEFASNGFNNLLEHTRGVISMARSQNPNSASSQFFIMHADAPYLDGEYAAFGVVTKGIEVIDKVANVKTNRYDAPLEKVIIKKIERIR